jgi:hypothetical protein
LYDLRKLRYTSLDISQFLHKADEDEGKKVLKVRAQTHVGEGEKKLEIGGEFDMKFRKPQTSNPLIQHCRGWYIESGRKLTEAETRDRDFDTRLFNADYENLFLARGSRFLLIHSVGFFFFLTKDCLFSLQPRRISLV